jgi:CRISPR-associated endonuclease Cas2
MKQSPLVRSRNFLVSYDISDDVRRSAISKMLTGWGTRVQLSLFECLLTEIELSSMLRELNELMVPEDDNILVHQCAAVGQPTHACLAAPQGTEQAFWVV